MRVAPLHSNHQDAMPDDTITADLFEIIRTTRSMRRLKPDPVPDALLGRILEAGVCAPSGGNMQRWRFLLVKDAAVKATIDRQRTTPTFTLTRRL